MGLVVCATFFLKYWRVTHDRLFLYFSLAFWLLALQRILLVSLNLSLSVNSHVGEKEIVFYTIRCVAFLIILLAIIDRTRRQKK